MENGSLADQEGGTVHGTRDIMDAADFHWSELARAPQNEAKGRLHYNGASNVGPESSTFHIENECPNSLRRPNSSRSRRSSSDEEEIVV